MAAAMLTHPLGRISGRPLAALVTAVVVIWSWQQAGFIDEKLRLFVVATLGFIMYVIMCFKLKIEQANKLYQWVKSGGNWHV